MTDLIIHISFCKPFRIPVLLSLVLVTTLAGADSILLETEQFEDFGGWVLDQQFMDEMGSPYLLAHGLGVPVSDATTTIEVGQSGAYRVLVRTRDWVGPWHAPGAPGRFEIKVNDKTLPAVFGIEGADWHWQAGPTVYLEKPTASVALQDLTGFEGRCDAILFTSEPNFIPPNTEPRMRRWRRKMLGLPDGPESAGEYDLVVVGGGIAGTCASLSAARLGLTVALVQDRPVLGGNNSSEIRVWLGGKTKYEPYPNIGNIVKELEPARRAHYGPENTAEIYEDAKRISMVRSQKNLKLFLEYRANEVHTREGRITAVIAENIRSGKRLQFEGRWFADCTGDGCVGFLAGADYDITLDGHMGRCNLWNVIETGVPVSFPRCRWAIDLSEKPFPGRNGKGLTDLGTWFWESGFYHNPFTKSEYIRDLNFRAMYGAWDCLKNVDAKYPNHKLNWAAYIAGKRESRRLLGDIVLSKQDLLEEKDYPDGCVPTSWPVDVHLPDPRYDKGFEGDEFISKAHYTQYPRPYWVPYRCLYSRNIDNLFMAGRNISVTHKALGTVRVMRTTGMMGEVVGLAASVCKKNGATPREVYEDYLSELKDLLKKGVPGPAQ